MSFLKQKANSVFNCNHWKGLIFVTKLRLGLSHVRQDKLKHSFQDSTNPFFSCIVDVESTISFTALCSQSKGTLSLTQSVKQTINYWIVMNLISIPRHLYYLVFGSCVFFSLYVCTLSGYQHHTEKKTKNHSIKDVCMNIYIATPKVCHVSFDEQQFRILLVLL